LTEIRFDKKGDCLDMELQKCPICERIPPSLEKHHLLPKPYRNRAEYRRYLKKETIHICIDCADMLHQLFTNKELAIEYCTLEKIIANSKIQKWIKWIENKKKFGICMKTKKRRK